MSASRPPAAASAVVVGNPAFNGWAPQLPAAEVEARKVYGELAAAEYAAFDDEWQRLMARAAALDKSMRRLALDLAATPPAAPPHRSVPVASPRTARSASFGTAWSGARRGGGAPRDRGGGACACGVPEGDGAARAASGGLCRQPERAKPDGAGRRA